MRKFTAEDRRLWDFVTRSVTPLKPRHAATESIEPAPPLRPRAVDIATSPTVIHRQTHQQPLHVGRLVDLDAATAKKFRKGRMPCDARLDLHGLTLAQAHSSLVHFIRNQSESGARSVLVITGKGAVDPTTERPRGRIKAELMHWLNAAPLRHVILAVTEANPKQSTGGAVYILLKRRERIAVV
jgi:DNA-nicking Smr family endonuclease